MRFPSTESRSSFLRELEIFCRERTKSLRTSALVNPNLYPSWEGTWKLPRDLDELILLAISSWYWDEDFSVLLRMQIQEKAEHNDDLFVLRFLTRSKVDMELFLLETTLWSPRSFFGSIFCDKMVRKVSYRLKPRWKPTRKPTRTVRRRGYKDKGSLRSSVPPERYQDFTKEQLLIEKERRMSEDTFKFLIGFLE